MGGCPRRLGYQSLVEPGVELRYLELTDGAEVRYFFFFFLIVQRECAGQALRYRYGQGTRMKGGREGNEGGLGGALTDCVDEM